MLLRDYLPRRLDIKINGVDPLKPSTAASYEEACALYFIPGLGHLPLCNIKKSDIDRLHSAMKKIGPPKMTAS